MEDQMKAEVGYAAIVVVANKQGRMGLSNDLCHLKFILIGGVYWNDAYHFFKVGLRVPFLVTI
jgi:hypothetical protein